MKKLIALLLALVMVIGLVACGNNDAPAADAPAADALGTVGKIELHFSGEAVFLRVAAGSGKGSGIDVRGNDAAGDALA